VKCRVCREPAVIDIRRHNANFCADHFLRLCRDQTAKAIDEFDMLAPGDRVLVAVSGGKDSLALWDILVELGYEADGLYIGLGIGGYSDRSGQMVRAFAEERGLTLHQVDLRADYDYDVPTAAKVTRRVPCSACGLSKRHLFDKAALDGGYDAVATGHNLDDEAAVLFGNTLRWQTEYLARQLPVLPARPGSPAR
jgi:tRNA(Ile)-lysidine synthase TilS/MesJ